MNLRKWMVAIALSATGSLASNPAAQAAPIVPQTGSQTQVQQAGNEFTITGGTNSADGQALFHAFEQLGLSQGQIATFLAQPGVQTILGGVVGGDASYIDGLLRVAGSGADLYLINPAGILFGPNAQLDLAGSFAATTASGVLFDEAIFNVLGDDDFSQLTGTPTGFVFALDEAGAIVNAADLAVASGEAITLIGGQVISTGTLTAPSGDITIAAIPEANLVRLSHPGMVLNLEIVPLPAESVTEGITPLTLPALLTGAPAALATGLSLQPDGTIALINSDATLAPTGGSAIATGTLGTTGTTGGDVAVVGDRVALLQATVNASGESGGGTVRLGGDYQGQGTLPGSSLTYVDAGSRIQANAGLAGDGGEVILWSDGTTAFYGGIRANGGTRNGDGGLVEVSGAQTLIFRGMVDTIAPMGESGTLLLDPVDIDIRSGMADGDDAGPELNLLNPTDIPLALTLPTEIYESELAGLAGITDVIVRADNNIIIENLADDRLTFEPGGVPSGSITFEAGGTFEMLDPNDTIVAPRRSLTITANTITAGHIDTSDESAQGGDVTLTAAGAIATGNIETVGDALSAGGTSGDVSVTGSRITTGRIRAGGGFFNDSRVELTATVDDIIVDTISAGSGGLEINAPRRFQARDVFDASPIIELDAVEDAALIDFLMRGNPQPLFDAGLVGSGFPVSIDIPTSILVSPDAGLPDPTAGSIVIRHGGAATNNFSDGNISIEGSGAFPTFQFVSGPNDDHTINIDASGPFASFSGFTTLFPAGTFPNEASGAIGAILRGRGDSTLVTRFPSLPFVPNIGGGTGGSSGGGSTGGGVSGGGSGGGVSGGITGSGGVGGGTGGSSGGQPAIAPGLNFETTTFENLAPDSTETAVEMLAEEEPGLSAGVDAVEDCEAAIANRSTNSVEITSTCETPASSEESEESEEGVDG